MRILLTSDLHRGHSASTGKILEKFGMKTLAKESWDVLVVAGDHASSSQEQYRTAMKAYRRWAGERPVLIVDGNHDFWNDPHVMPWDVEERHTEWAREHNIIRLENGPYSVPGFTFVGWMGWYARPPTTNDFAYWIPPKHSEGWPMHHWFKFKESRELSAALEAAALADGQIIVAVTHFPIHRDSDHYASPSHMLVIQDVADFVLCGHSHLRVDLERNGVQYLNCGGDYDKPAFVILEV